MEKEKDCGIYDYKIVFTCILKAKDSPDAINKAVYNISHGFESSHEVEML